MVRAALLFCERILFRARPAKRRRDLVAGEVRLDIESLFQSHYERLARVIARVVRDPAPAEELAVEAFLKWSRSPEAQGPHAEGWLFRTAVRLGLDELRRQARRSRYERLLGIAGASPRERDRAGSEERERVRVTLSVLEPRHAELLLLRADGLSYDEVAAALKLNPSSVGTLLARARQAFRKEYVKRYGEQ